MTETTTERTPFDLPTETTEAPEPSAPPRELVLTGDQPELLEVVLPYAGAEFVCPACEEPIATRKQVTLGKPARFFHLLNDVMKCPNCSFIFSYKTSTVRVLRQ